MEFERRVSGLELRAEGRRLSGTVMRYGDVSESHRERFEPGALRAAENCWLDLHHDPMKAVSWLKGGGLALQNGRDALTMRATLPPIPAANVALEEIKSGKISGLSVEFKAVRESRDGEIRVVEDAILSGIGLVAKPSYEQSQVEARRRVNSVPNPSIKAQWRARKRGACRCQGQDCDSADFEPGAFSESLESDGEMLALAGSNRPLASRNKGTLAIRETDSGDVEVEIDRVAADSDIGRDVAGQAKATRVVARPWLDVEASTYTEQGRHRRFTKAALKGLIIKPTVDDNGWEEIQLVTKREGRATLQVPKRRARLWL